METIFAIVGVILFFAFANVVIQGISRTLRAAGRAVVGKGSLSANLEVAFKGMGPLEGRLIDQRLGDDGKGLLAKELQIKGLIPIDRKRRLAFVTSVFDNTSGTFEPVLSALETFQESHTVAFQHLVDVGPIDAGVGFIDWIRAGVVLPQILEPPFGGKRQFVALLRLVDADNTPDITNGFHQRDHAGLLWQRSLPFEFVIEGRGYVEAGELRDEGRAICIHIAMPLALKDGVIGDSEGAVLKRWVEKAIGGVSGERLEKMKSTLNTAMRQAYANAKSREFSMTPLVRRLNELGEVAVKYEAIELCFDIAAASGVAHAGQARAVNLIAEALELDPAEVAKLRDVRIVDLRLDISGEAYIEQLLGIDRHWDGDQIKRHLRNEFQKWNNRLTSLPEGKERENAQKMLDAIAVARKRYD